MVEGKGREDGRKTESLRGDEAAGTSKAKKMERPDPNGKRIRDSQSRPTKADEYRQNGDAG